MLKEIWRDMAPGLVAIVLIGAILIGLHAIQRYTYQWRMSHNCELVQHQWKCGRY